MSRTIQLVCLLALCCLFVRGAAALPPPVVTLEETSQITASARLFEGTTPWGPSPHGGDDTYYRIFGLNYHFVAFWNQNEQLCMARMPSSGGNWVVITFTDAILPPDKDSHRTPNVGISPNDGRIHLAYGHHNDALRYRMSVAGAATVPDSQFTKSYLFPSPSGNERNYLKSGESITRCTYPNFVVRETDRQMLLFWRDGSVLKEYDATYNDNGTWGSKRYLLNGTTGTYVDPTAQYPNSTTRRPYLFDVATLGNDLHLSWTWRDENPGGAWAHHDLMYIKSTDGAVSWRNTAGTAMSLPILYTPNNSNGARVWEINYFWELQNAGTSAVDSEGNSHVLLHHTENGLGTPWRFWHYKRIGTTWTRTMLPCSATSWGAMGLFIDRAYDTVYAVGGQNGVIKVYAAQRQADTGETNWEKWTECYVGTQPYRLVGRGWLANDGTTLRVLAQRPGVDSSSTYSELDLVKFSLDFDGP